VTVVEKAEELLASIREIETDLEGMRAARDREIEEVRTKHKAMIDSASTARDRDAKALTALMKSEHNEIFQEGDKRDLAGGVLYYSRVEKASFPRGEDAKAAMIAEIEKHGWNGGIVVKKDLDKPVIAEWPSERLAVIGVKRRPVDDYAYDLVEKKQSGQGG
jgi:hypothetical protein